jgi:radical SAM protein with 4Fe4S-binding SPASM domain
MSGTPQPRSLLIEITQRCNHACLHCYNVWQGEPRDSCSGYPRGELDTASMLELLSIALDQTGCHSITLTGGEPLLRADLPFLLDFLRERNVRVTLISNGRLLDDAKAAALIQGGVGLFELPLLSHRRETHDLLSGTPGAWDAVLRAMSAVRVHGGQFAAAFVATRLNIGNVYESIRLAFAFGARALMFNRFNPGGRGRLHMAELLPSVDQVRQALATAEAAAQEFGIPVACSIPIPPCRIDTSAFPHINFGYCAAGTQRAYYTIDPLGNVRPCNHSPLILGNLFHDSFESIVAGPLHADFLGALPASCRQCTEQDICRGSCQAAAQACYGSLNAAEPFLCSAEGQQLRS